MVETRKFMAEQSKLKQETFWYPFAVGAGRVIAIVSIECANNEPLTPIATISNGCSLSLSRCL